jgi:hypothetical protein
MFEQPFGTVFLDELKELMFANFSKVGKPLRIGQLMLAFLASF